MSFCQNVSSGLPGIAYLGLGQGAAANTRFSRVGILAFCRHAGRNAFFRTRRRAACPQRPSGAVSGKAVCADILFLGIRTFFLPNSGGGCGFCLLFSLLWTNLYGNRNFPLRFAARNLFLSAKTEISCRKEIAGDAEKMAGKNGFCHFFVQGNGFSGAFYGFRRGVAAPFLLLFVHKIRETVSNGILVFYGWVDVKVLIFASKILFLEGGICIFVKNERFDERGYLL